MLKIHITKVNNKVLMPDKDFERLLHEAEKNNTITVETDEFEDLIEASSKGLDFWDNDIDDKVWNNA
jgi:hypothetical protein